jgi:hypothetical protein
MEICWDIADSEWQAQLGACPHGLRQSPEYGQAMAAFGAGVGRAVLRDGGRPVGLVQVLQRKGLRVVNDGPVWLAEIDPAQKRRAVRMLARHAGVTVATPPERLAGFGLLPLITPQHRAVWALDQTPEALRAGLWGKWRNRLLRAEAEVRVQPLNTRDLQTLVSAEGAQRRARGYNNLPGALALNWPGKTLALGWKAKGAVQAGMVFLVHGASASYFLGWTGARGRAVFAHGPILWQAAAQLQAIGVQSLDLGGVDTEDGAGLARFKLGTGAQLRAMGATSLVVPGGWLSRRQRAGLIGARLSPIAVQSCKAVHNQMDA